MTINSIDQLIYQGQDILEEIDMRKKVLIFFVILFSLILFVPFPTISIPEWRLQIVGVGGEPLKNERVRQEWSYSELLGTSVETVTSDENGYVKFPPRVFVAPLILRVIIKIIEYTNYLIMPHGSRIGVYSRIICEAGTYYWLEYREGGKLEDRLIVKKL